MTDLLLAGGLAQLQVAQAVLGRAVRLVPAATATGRAGLLLVDASAVERDRLTFYTAVLQAEPSPDRLTEGGAVLVYCPPPLGLPEIEDTFAAEVMARFGRQPPEDVSPWLGRLKDRAWSRHLAKGSAPRGVRRGGGGVTVEREGLSHDRFFAVKTHDLRPDRFDGGTAQPLTRETFHATDAAIVLPYDPATDQVLVVEQFRMGPFVRGEGLPWKLEPVAGLIDAGETPEETAHRECLEEAGLALNALLPAPSHYPSPGGTTDYFHCFVGLCDLSDFVPGIGGKADENEDILSHVLPFEVALGLIETGEADVGPLVMLLLWLSLRREGLRQGV